MIGPQAVVDEAYTQMKEPADEMFSVGGATPMLNGVKVLMLMHKEADPPNTGSYVELTVMDDEDLDEAVFDDLTAAGLSPTLPPPVNVDVPHVQGTATVGSTLTCTKGNWEGGPDTYAYKWLSDATPVGTDTDTYVVEDTDKGHSITCVLTATNVGGSTEAPPSNAVLIPA